MKPKSLEDFPKFILSSVQVNGNEIKFFGSFKDSKGVSERRSWLVSGQEYYIGDLIDFNVDKKTAVFVNWDEASKNVKQGSGFYWIKGDWNLDFIYRVLDKNKPWVKEKFKASDAQVYIQNDLQDWKVSCKVGQKIPEDAKVIEIVPNGWDHEHCSICDEKIGNYGEPNCYKDDQYYLCVSCFEKYACNHDLSFTDEFYK